MSELQGTNIAAPIMPFDSEDTFPTHLEEYGQGGYRSVASRNEIDTIPVDRLKLGMLVYVYEQEKYYTLTNIAKKTWKEVTFNSNGTSNISWENILNKPTSFSPENHNHQISDISNLSQNIKTINNESIIGTGNIVISSGISSIKRARYEIDLTSSESIHDGLLEINNNDIIFLQIRATSVNASDVDIKLFDTNYAGVKKPRGTITPVPFYETNTKDIVNIQYVKNIQMFNHELNDKTIYIKSINNDATILDYKVIIDIKYIEIGA